MRTNILVVGGAGYIGSHMVDALLRNNFNIVVLDNLSTGHRDAIGNNPCIVADINDSSQLHALFSSHHFDAVMHFASLIQVGESVTNPIKYYLNNVSGTLQLLRAMIKHKIKYFIFSSTAAVYGNPHYLPIDENHPMQPINPYGHSKKMIEQVLQDFSRAYDFKYISLRYFNAAGAHPEGHLRERHEPESHLIPIVLHAAKNHHPVTIYGRDYDTEDGTCVRDYVHVNDLCDAHLLALKKLFSGADSAIYNLGNGQGHSVQQVIETVQKIIGNRIIIKEGARRAGDPAVLIANAERACRELQWRPQYSKLEVIIQHAWNSCLLDKPILLE